MHFQWEILGIIPKGLERISSFDLGSEPEKIKLRKKTNREFSAGRQELKQVLGKREWKEKSPDTFVSWCWSLKRGAPSGAEWKLEGEQGLLPHPPVSLPSLPLRGRKMSVPPHPTPRSRGFSQRTRGHQPPSDSPDFQRTPTLSRHDTTSQRGHVSSSFIKSSLRGTRRNGPATSLNLLWLLSSPPPPLSTSLCSVPLSLPTLLPHTSLPAGAQRSENSPGRLPAADGTQPPSLPCPSPLTAWLERPSLDASLLPSVLPCILPFLPSFLSFSSFLPPSVPPSTNNTKHLPFVRIPRDAGTSSWHSWEASPRSLSADPVRSSSIHQRQRSGTSNQGPLEASVYHPYMWLMAVGCPEDVTGASEEEVGSHLSKHPFPISLPLKTFSTWVPSLSLSLFWQPLSLLHSCSHPPSLPHHPSPTWSPLAGFCPVWLIVLQVCAFKVARSFTHCFPCSYCHHPSEKGHPAWDGCSGLVHWDDPEGWDGEGGRRGDRDGEHM